MLVPAMRPADVPWVIGWSGACNLSLSGADISSVLRSWEDRFGAVLTSMGFDELLVVTDSLPTRPDVRQLEAIGAEHYAFCPDNIDQGAESMKAYLPQIERGRWPFWWD